MYHLYLSLFTCYQYLSVSLSSLYYVCIYLCLGVQEDSKVLLDLSPSALQQLVDVSINTLRSGLSEKEEQVIAQIAADNKQEDTKLVEQGVVALTEIFIQGGKKNLTSSDFNFSINGLGSPNNPDNPDNPSFMEKDIAYVIFTLMTTLITLIFLGFDDAQRKILTDTYSSKKTDIREFLNEVSE